MKLLAKNKFNIKILLIYFGLSLCFLYTFGGFMRDNIIFDPNEVKLGRQCMLFNLKRLDLLKSNVMEEYTFNRYTRFSKKNPDIRMKFAYTDADNVIDYYKSKGQEKGWVIESVEKDSLAMHRMDTVRGELVNVIFQIAKMEINSWEINVKYNYISKKNTY